MKKTEKEINDIRLVASDLDGTLLPAGAQSIENRTIDLINTICEKGIVFCAASGRQYPTLKHLFAGVCHDICYMCLNGGLCIYKGKIFYKKILKPDEAMELADDIYRMKGCEVMLSAAEYEYLVPKNPDFVHVVRDIMKADYRIVQKLDEIRDPILKISVYDENGQIDPEFWKERYGNRFAVQTSGAFWMDICPRGVNKGNGIQTVADYFHIDPKNIMAFGDNENDIPMLSAVGVPVAMESGLESVKETARCTTPTVADVLRKLIS